MMPCASVDEARRAAARPGTGLAVPVCSVRARGSDPGSACATDPGARVRDRDRGWRGPARGPVGRFARWARSGYGWRPLEVSPSPVYGARLLSGFGTHIPSRVRIPPPPPALERPAVPRRAAPGLASSASCPVRPGPDWRFRAGRGIVLIRRQAGTHSLMDRASDYGSEGWGFDSLWVRHPGPRSARGLFHARGLLGSRAVPGAPAQPVVATSASCSRSWRRASAWRLP